MKKILLFILMCNLNSCTSQIKNKTNLETYTKTDTMEYFNIKDYEKLKKDPEFSNRERDTRYLLDDKRIRITYYKEKIQVAETSKTNPIEISKGFYRESKSLMYIGKLFYDFEIGIWGEYNEQGKLTKETNYDLPYKFSIEDLKQKMLKEYDVDIMNLENIFTIDRFIIDTATYYTVQAKEMSKLTNYLIDGSTGKTLYTDTTFLKQKKGSILDRYLAKSTRQENLHTRYKGKDYTLKEWEAYQKTDEYKKDNPSIWEQLFGKKKD